MDCYVCIAYGQLRSKDRVPAGFATFYCKFLEHELVLVNGGEAPVVVKIGKPAWHACPAGCLPLPPFPSFPSSRSPFVAPSPPFPRIF